MGASHFPYMFLDPHNLTTAGERMLKGHFDGF